MTKTTKEINNFINISFKFLSSYFNQKCNNKYFLEECYPYIKNDIKNNISYEFPEYNITDFIGGLYESLIPINIKKDFGKFYTNKSDIIQHMLKPLDLLKGKILEPSCGAGTFVVHIILKLLFLLDKSNLTSEEKLNYICDHIYANDNDINAIKITELNVLSHLLPLIIDAKINNPNFVMKKLNLTNLDFIEKDCINEKFSLLIGNPPFVTMYGKQSRNMTEIKRLYYNTFNFVQDRKKNNKFNTSMFFIENGLNLLEKNGRLSFIVDIAFFETAFVDLRKYIVQNYFINSLTVEMNEFSEVASGQAIIDITNINKKNPNIKFINYETKEINIINQNLWDNDKNHYKFTKPLLLIEKIINEKLSKFKSLNEIFPKKSLRTCCALTGRTEDFIVNPSDDLNYTIFPYIEGSKGINKKFQTPIINRYIKYDYNLQIEISNEFKKELELKGIKNKKRVTLGDKEAYLSDKIFIRQSSKEIIATFCEKPYAANNSIYILTTKQNNLENKRKLKYTCGILNSELITFYSRINSIIRMRKGKTPQIKISDLKKIKIAIKKEYYDNIINIVDKLIKEPDNQYFYDILNNYVYLLYGITHEEITYIKTYLKENEYNL